MNAINSTKVYVIAFILIFMLLTTGTLLVYFRFDRFVSADAIREPMPQTIEESKRPELKNGVPVRISIEDLEIDQHVKKGSYDTQHQSWTLDSENVFINTLTNADVLIGKLDDSIPTPLLYGHNSLKVLGKTKRIQPGQELLAVTNNGLVISYTYVRSIELEPNESWILEYKGEEDLMLMTCTGTWHEKRRVLFFKLNEIKETRS